ncbi:MAG: hypothetical protein GXO48_06495 [Chlorobi bacterium]|nr:hypothetical protein [Chlorobiota bacterium]
MLKRWHWIGGRFAEKDELQVSARLLGLLRGWAIFDYFLSVGGELSPITDLYLDRFYTSASRLKLEVPVSREDLKELLRELINLNGGIQAFRLVLSAGESSDGWNPDGKPVLMIFSEAISEVPQQWFSKGISLKTYQFLRPLPQVKTTFYVVGKLAQMDADTDDVLFVYGGNVLETPRSNIFFVKDNALITAGNNVLKGITRKLVIEIAQERGLEIIERDVPLNSISDMDGAFITGTTKPIVPVRQIDDVGYEVTRMKEMLDLLRNELLERTGLSINTVVSGVLND